MQKVFCSVRLSVLCCVALVVGGCGGFHLRGRIAIPEYLRVVYITPQMPYIPLQSEVRAMLHANKVRILNHPSDGVSILELSDVSFVQQPLAFGSSGQLQRLNFLASLTYTFRVPGAQGFVKHKTIQMSRELNVSINELLSNENQSAIVKNELIKELANALLAQISSGPSDTTHNSSDSVAEDSPC